MYEGCLLIYIAAFLTEEKFLLSTVLLFNTKTLCACILPFSIRNVVLCDIFLTNLALRILSILALLCLNPNKEPAVFNML